MTERLTAGQQSLKASKDSTKYDSREVGHALVEDGSIARNLVEAAQRHRAIFDMDEYCVGYVIASDPLIAGVMRRKFFAYPHLPSPRPEQAIFLYNKPLDKITKRLWVLPAAFSNNPNAWTMERLYVTDLVPNEYQTMKAWSKAFYDGVFWDYVRKDQDISMLSEHEYLKANREKFIEAGSKEFNSNLTESFDFSKITVNKVVDSNAISA